MPPKPTRALTTQSSFCSRLLQMITSQFTDPIRRPGNTTILFNMSLFAVTVVVLKKFGNLLAV
ncbi:hypothetical protein H4R33_001501, partial [Dimargaris cristalligena]